VATGNLSVRARDAPVDVIDQPMETPVHNQDLMYLKESAVDLIAAVRDDKVVQIKQRTATYAINGTTRCTRRANNLVEMGAIRVSDRTADGRYNHRLYELTDDGREALTLYRPRPIALPEAESGPDHSPGAANVLPGITCTIPGHCDTRLT
jgi:hypothetical protein